MKIFFLWVILLNTAFAYLPENSDTIAVIGKTFISRNEFLERYEFTPWPRSKFDASTGTFKNEFLNTLIAEKLWALEAEKLGLDSSETMVYTFKNLEKIYVRDALYRAEILNKIEVPDSVLNDGYSKIQYLLKVDYKVFSNKEDAGKVFQSLKKGFPFDYVNKDLGDIAKDSSAEVSFGQMDEGIENLLYKMHPGEYTAPIQSKNGWYIFRLASKKDNPIMNAASQEKADKQVKSTIHTRLIQKRYDEFIKAFFTGRKINAKAHILKSLAVKLYNLRNEKLKSGSTKEKLYFDSEVYTRIEKEFGQDTLNMDFIELDNKPVTLKQYLSDLAFTEFSFEVSSKSGMFSRVNSNVKSFIEKELLAREGYSRGLQNLPEVKNEIKMWKDYYLSQLHKKQFVDNISVTDDEIKNYYKTRNEGGQSVTEVNIVEVLTDSLETVETILDKLRKHIDMHEIAKQYTKRESMHEKRGEFGFFPVTMYGEIGRIAGTLQPGQVYGPLKVPEGYSVFQLIDKREKKAKTIKSFEESKDEIKRNLISFKLNREVVNHTVQLAKNYGIKINQEALNSIEVNNITMFVYRYMGFGGRITSVPLSVPFTDWVDQWEESRSDIP